MMRPAASSTSASSWTITAEWTFEPGMVIVAQPNVFTEDERAGLQFGTTVVIRPDGPEVIQEYPAEFLQV